MPEDRKVLNVTQILTKGSRKLLVNNLTSVSGKLVESILKDEIIGHVDAVA